MLIYHNECNTKYLGYGFYQNNETQLKVHKEILKKLKAKLKAVTSRSNVFGYRQRRIKINQIIRGWIQYFKLENMKNHLQKLDEWLRRRGIRMCAWKTWKKVITKFRNLVKLGIAKFQAWQWVNTHKSY